MGWGEGKERIKKKGNIKKKKKKRVNVNSKAFRLEYNYLLFIYQNKIIFINIKYIFHLWGNVICMAYL